MKTNLSIESRPGGWNDGRGNWQVIGKLTGSTYSTGSKYNCTWQISNNPEWRYEEERHNERRELEYRYLNEMQAVHEDALHRNVEH